MRRAGWAVGLHGDMDRLPAEVIQDTPAGLVRRY